MRTIENVLREAKKTISALDAEVLLGFVLAKNRTHLFANGSAPIFSDDEKRFFGLVERCANGEPVAYAVGKREFFGRDFFVSPAVLIPRPETEELVSLALGFLALNHAKTVVDVGTGSGAIAISLALADRGFSVLGSDISAAALEVACQNATAFGATVDFRLGDLLEPFLDDSIDAVVANLPYIPEGVALPISTRFEPENALFSGADGLLHYRRLWLQMAKKSISLGIFEIDRSHAALAKSIAVEIFPNATVEILSDSSGFPRFLRFFL